MSQNENIHRNYLELKIVIDVADDEKENIIRFLNAAHGLSHSYFVPALANVLLMHESTSIADRGDVNCYFSATLRGTQFPEY